MVATSPTPELSPGDRVKVVVSGTVLRGEIVARSPSHPKEWLIRTFFHDLIALDESCIITKKREEYFRKLFKKGTPVLLQHGDVECAGVVIDSVIEIVEGNSVYIPIVLVGNKKRMISAAHLSVVA